jgi:flagellar protein FlaF
MPSNPLNAYKEVERNTLEGRDLEAMVLSKAAVLLQSVQNHWTGADLDSRLDEALRYNLKLWTLFQAELSSPENPLPPEVKKNLLTLSKFIDKRTYEVLSSPAPEKLDILISINQNIAAGLREKPAAKAVAAAAR